MQTATLSREKNGEAARLAEEIGLRYTSDTGKGYTREKVRGKFEYFDTAGLRIAEEKTLARIQNLKIPPAWQQVWICPSPKGHLQCTGLDVKMRKQYLYHPDWTRLRCENKFSKMAAFGRVLPAIRKQVQQDLASHTGFTREKMLATVVGLLDHTLIRIGNKAYEKENNSYGLTTLRNRHMKSMGNKILFEFTGKKGVKQSVQVTDSKLARIVKKCKEIPGHQLFQYYSEDGSKHQVTSDDVNRYLKEITGDDFTAKDFRTWGGSAYGVRMLQQMEFPETEKELKSNVNSVLKAVAQKLGNTVAVCRKHYLHPIVIQAYTDNHIAGFVKKYPNYHLKGSRLLHPEEKLFMLILEKLT